MLEIPVTSRVPETWEMDHRSDIEELLRKRKMALIVEGYRLTLYNHSKIPYTFQAEININNSSLWKLVAALAALLPADIVVEYSLNEEETYLTESLSKNEALQKLNKFETELVQDCSLSFTLSSHSLSGLTEMIVTPSKYIRFSATEKDLFLMIMKRFSLEEKPAIVFIDEYPQITEPLKKFLPTSRRPEDVIWSLNRSFNIET